MMTCAAGRGDGDREGRRGEHVAVPERLRHRRVAVDRVRVADGVGELADLLAADLVRPRWADRCGRRNGSSAIVAVPPRIRTAIRADTKKPRAPTPECGPAGGPRCAARIPGTSRRLRGGLRGPRETSGSRGAGCACCSAAVLLQLKTVRVVAPVLLGDVVALLALHAGQRDLRADVGSSHGSASFFFEGSGPSQVGPHDGQPDRRTALHRLYSRCVAVAGLEPVTQRL